MKSKKMILSLFLSVIFIFAAAISVSAARLNYEDNTVHVKTFGELRSALSAVSTESNPPEKLVVLDSQINITNNENCAIKISYPGKITLDLNGNDFSLDSAKTNKMFSIEGENDPETTFSIINGNDSKAASITFRSALRQSSVIHSNNPNANINIFGKAKYDPDNVLTGSSGHSICLKTSPFSSSDTYVRYTMNLNKVNDVYISGAEFCNSSLNPSNISFGQKAGNVELTGQSKFIFGLTNVTSRPSSANINFNTLPKSLEFGGVYISSLNNVKSLNYANTSVRFSNIVKTDVNGIQSAFTVIIGSTWNSYINSSQSINIRFKCCSVPSPKTTTEVTLFGHTKYCNLCGGVTELEKHTFSSLSIEEEEATCTDYGVSAAYNCKTCNYYTGYQIIPATGHKWEKVILTERSCFKDGCYGTICKVCKTEDREKRETILAYGKHNELMFDNTYCGTCREYFNPQIIGLGSQSVKKNHACFFSPEKDGTYTIKAVLNNPEIFEGYMIYRIFGNKRQSKVLFKYDGTAEAELKGGETYSIVVLADESTEKTVTLKINEKGIEHSTEGCSCNCHKKGIAKFFFKIGLFFQKIFKKNKICKCGISHY